MALTALVFFGWGLALVVPVASRRGEVERRAVLLNELEQMEWQALELLAPSRDGRASAGGVGWGRRIASLRDRLAAARRAAEGDPKLESGLGELSGPFGRLEAMAAGGVDEEADRADVRAEVVGLRTRSAWLRAGVQQRNAESWAELNRAWDGLGYLVAVIGALALGTAALSWRDARRRRVAEDRLRQSEERYQGIYDRSPVAIVVWDLGRGIVDWNRCAEALFGWPLAEVEGRDLVELLIPEGHRDAVIAGVEALIRDGGTSVSTLPARARSGEERLCEWHCSIALGGAGRAASVVSTVLDVTERRRAEAAVRRSEARYRRLFDSNIIGVMVGSEDGSIDDANDAFLALIGYSRDDLRAGRLRWSDMTPSEYGPLDRRAIDELRTTGVATPYEKEYIREDGSRVPIEIGAAQFDDEGGTSVCFVLDLTERRRAQRRARSANALLETIRRAQLGFIDAPDLGRAFDTLLEGLLDLTASAFGFIGEVLENPEGLPDVSLRAATGSDRDGDPRAPEADPGGPGRGSIDLQGLFGRVVTTGRAVIADASTHAPRRDDLPEEHPPIDTFLGLPFFRGEAVAGVIGIANRPEGYSEEDVAFLEPLLSTCSSLVAAQRAEAHRSRAEADLQASKEAAEAANRAKDRFLAVLSHELRTPLTPVLAAVTAARDDASTTPALRELFEMVRRNVELESRLIGDLLDITRIGRGLLRLETAVVDAHALIREVLSICRDEVESAGLRVDLDLRAVETHVEADPARLQQVIWNLIKNAVKFTPAGGTVSVRSRDEPDPAAVANGANGHAPGARRLVVEVADTGVGLDPADTSRIFDAFEQGESSLRLRSGGLGLGLAISRSVVELSGGRLTARSEGRDRGATFRIDLPAVPEPPPPLAPAPPTAPPAEAGAGGLDILLVEDNRDTLHYLSLLLDQSGHRVREAATFAQAVEALDSGTFDLLISDIELPDGNGLDVARHLRATRGPTVPAIAMTGFGSDDDVRLSLDAGFLAHLTKPVDFRRLAAAIREAVPSSHPARRLGAAP